MLTVRNTNAETDRLLRLKDVQRLTGLSRTSLYG